MKKIIKKVIPFLIFIIIIISGLIYWQKYTEEKKRKLAEEEKRKMEEIEKEKQRQFLEKKKAEYFALIEEMKKYFQEGNYSKVKELAEEALAIAKEFNFDTTEINKILHKIEVAKYLRKLKELEECNKNIYNYSYVRNEISKIPSWKELINLKEKIYKQTFQNEYLVLLELAEKSAINGKQGKEPSLNYFSSRDYLYKAVNLRKNRNLKPSIEREKEIAETQKETFFAYKELKENSIPSSLYQ